MLKMFVTLLTLLLLPSISGCGADEVEVIEDVRVNFVSATPPTGSAIGANASVTLTFDSVPRDVTTNRGDVEFIQNGIIVSRLYTDSLGEVELKVTWAGGTHTLLYVLTAPCADEDEDTGCG